jgi:uncharacterized phiE125 gp8 family phage protein
VREFLRLSDSSQTDMDAALSTFITQASKAIHHHTGREFAPLSTASQTRLFEYYGGGTLFFTPYDAQSVTEVLIDTESGVGTELVEDSDYFLKPRNAQQGVYTHMELRGCEPSAKGSSDASKPWREISVTGTWGFASVPADIAAAANMLVAFWYRNHSAVAGRDLQNEGDRFGPVNMPTGVLQLLAPYRVLGFGYGA